MRHLGDVVSGLLVVGAAIAAVNGLVLVALLLGVGGVVPALMRRAIRFGDELALDQAPGGDGSALLHGQHTHFGG